MAAESGAIQTPTLEIPVELDMAAGKRALRELERDAKRSGDQVGSSLADAGGETKKFTDRLKDAAAALGGIVLLVGNRVMNRFRGLGRVLGGVVSTLVDMTAIGLLGVSRGLRRLDTELEDNGRAWKAVGDAAGAAATALDAAAGILIRVGAALTGAKLAAGAAAAALVIAANRASSNFTPSWNRVLTLIQGSPAELAKLRHEVSMLAGELGENGPAAADTFYQVLSALPELAQDPVRALEVLRVSLEAASTGFVEASTAAEAIAAIMVAFNLEATEARRVSDALFAAQDRGVLTFGEVASSIGRVSGLAATLNVEFEELLGIAATLTPTGLEVSEVFTQVRGVLNNVLRPSAEARREAERLGIQFNAAAVEARGLVPFLRDVIDATDGSSESLARLFTSQEALGLVVALSKDMDSLEEAVRAVGDSAGSTAEKFEQMNQSAERQREILKNRLAAELRGLGEMFEGLQIAGLKAINGVLTGADKLADGLNAVRDASQGAGESLRAALAGPKADLDDIARDLRRQELQFLLFGETALRQNQTIAGVRGGPIPRPAEPTSIEFSRFKIAQEETLRVARAIAALARSGDMEAYEAAVRETQEAVNGLVIAEMERLRAAGVSEAEVAKLASAYRVLKDETERLAEARRRLKESLEDRVFRLTADAAAVELRALDRLEEEFREAFGTIPAEVEAGLARLRENVRRADVLSGFREQFESIETDTIGARDALVDLFHQLREEADQLPENVQIRKEYLDLLRQIADAIDQVTDAERRERQERGKDDDEAARRAEQERLRNLRDQARTLEENARAAIQVAEAFGLIGSEAANALEDVAQLAAAVARIAGGDLTAIPAALGATASLLGSAFGTSPEEKLRQEMLAENNRRLEELALGIADLSSALRGTEGANIAGVRAALQNTGEALGSNLLFGHNFRRELLALGLTMEDVEEVARGLGIEWDGSAAAARQLLEALQQFELDQLFESFAGQMDLLQFTFDTLDIEDPVEQMEKLLEVFREFAGVDVPAFDLATEAGRAAAEAWIEQMTQAIVAGDLTPEMLGGMSLDQFMRFLADLENRLDQAGGGVVGGAAVTRLGVSITEEQGSAFISISMSQLHELRLIRALLGGGSLPVVAPPPPEAVGLGGGGTSVVINGLEIDVDIPIHTTGGVSAEELRRGGQAAGGAMAEELRRRLGEIHRGNGGLGAPKVPVERRLR